jgi:iron complex outermembrane recepter protein
MKFFNYLAVGLVCVGTMAYAQEKPADTTLDEMLVTGLPLNETVLPTVRPVSSALGTDANVLDTPRSVSTITKAQLEARQIHDVNSLGQYSAGTYTPSIFGAQGVPTIRGVLSELYQNGQRMKFVRNSFPPSFNGVEALDIVKGPGSPVFGPTPNVGGYVNFVTKQPYFDKMHLDITGKIGTYVPGGQSYFSPEWTVDLSVPIIKDKLAARISYFGREADGYYQNTIDHVQDVFLAVTFLPSDNLTFDYNAQFYETSFNENVGFNRVTQEMIDDRKYVSGPITPLFFGSPGPGWAGYVDSGADKSFSDQKKKLYPFQTLTNEGDSAYGKRFSTQLISTVKLTEDWKIVNRTMFDTLETRKYSTYGYSEFVPKSDTFDTRLELHGKFSLFGSTSTVSKPSMSKDGLSKDGKKMLEETVVNEGIVNSFILGASYRYEDSESYQDFDNEPFAVYDLYRGQRPQFPPDVIFGGRIIPGAPKNYTAGAFGTASRSTLEQVGFFLQDEIKFNKYVSLFGGIRVDLIDGEARRPKLGTFLNGTGGKLAEGPRNQNSDSVQAYFGSLVIKPLEWITVYATYNKTTAAATTQFGSLSQNFKRLDLVNDSELYETGVKVSALDNTLFASISGYYQNRIARDRFFNAQGVQSRGIEIETTYQPNRNFNASANMTFVNSNLTGITGKTQYSQTQDYLNTLGPGFKDTNGGKGNGGENPFGGFSPNYGGSPTSGTSPKIAGKPDFLFNAYATYMLDCGLGLSVGPQVTGEIKQNYQGTLKIPAQVTWNAVLFYKQKDWEVQLNVYNFTDERNFTPTDNFAANDLIFPDKPLSADLTFKLKFYP